MTACLTRCCVPVANESKEFGQLLALQLRDDGSKYFLSFRISRKVFIFIGGAQEELVDNAEQGSRLVELERNLKGCSPILSVNGVA